MEASTCPAPITAIPALYEPRRGASFHRAPSTTSQATASSASASWCSSSNGITCSTTRAATDACTVRGALARLDLTVYKQLEEFRRLFPGQVDPTQVCHEIWEGVAAQQHESPFGFVETMRVNVVPAAA